MLWGYYHQFNFSEHKRDALCLDESGRESVTQFSDIRVTTTTARTGLQLQPNAMSI